MRLLAADQVAGISLWASYRLMLCIAISEGHGDTAMALLKAGAESDKRDENDKLAIELAPDKKVT